MYFSPVTVYREPLKWASGGSVFSHWGPPGSFSLDLTAPHCLHVRVSGQVTVLPGGAGDERMGIAHFPKAEDVGASFLLALRGQPTSPMFLSGHRGS